jgi:hypothetical protein
MSAIFGFTCGVADNKIISSSMVSYKNCEVWGQINPIECLVSIETSFQQLYPRWDLVVYLKNVGVM